MQYLEEYLREVLKDVKKVAFLGVGSELRSDDAVGMRLIGILKMLLDDRDDVLLIPASTAPENFTGVIKDFAPDRLFIVDAAHLNEEPGTIGIVTAENIGGIEFSTHMLPFSVMVDYLEKETGCPISILGIQPKSLEMFGPVTPPVLRALKEISSTFVEIWLEK